MNATTVPVSCGRSLLQYLAQDEFTGVSYVCQQPLNGPCGELTARASDEKRHSTVSKAVDASIRLTKMFQDVRCRPTVGASCCKKRPSITRSLAAHPVRTGSMGSTPWTDTKAKGHILMLGHTLAYHAYWAPFWFEMHTLCSAQIGQVARPSSRGIRIETELDCWSLSRPSHRARLKLPERVGVRRLDVYQSQAGLAVRIWPNL